MPHARLLVNAELDVTCPDGTLKTKMVPSGRYLSVSKFVDNGDGTFDLHLRDGVAKNVNGTAFSIQGNVKRWTIRISRLSWRCH